MKKLFCALLCLCLASTAFATRADAELVSCTLTINLDKANKNKNVLDYTLKVSNTSKTTKVAAAFYFEGALEKIEIFDISAQTEITSSIEHNETPDCIKVFFWQNNLRPVCAASSVLDAATLEATNSPIITQLNNGLAEMEKVERAVKTTKERQIVKILKECATDAVSRNTEYLLTREFAQRFYREQLLEVKDIYSSMTDTEKNDFVHTHFLDVVSIRKISTLMDYLDLMKIIN